jgi:hypothetical protein
MNVLEDVLGKIETEKVSKARTTEDRIANLESDNVSLKKLAAELVKRQLALEKKNSRRSKKPR